SMDGIVLLIDDLIGGWQRDGGAAVDCGEVERQVADNEEVDVQDGTHRTVVVLTDIEINGRGFSSWGVSHPEMIHGNAAEGLTASEGDIDELGEVQDLRDIEVSRAKASHVVSPAAAKRQLDPGSRAAKDGADVGTRQVDGARVGIQEDLDGDLQRAGVDVERDITALG